MGGAFKPWPSRSSAAQASPTNRCQKANKSKKADSDNALPGNAPSTSCTRSKKEEESGDEEDRKDHGHSSQAGGEDQAGAAEHVQSAENHADEINAAGWALVRSSALISALGA